LGEKSESLSNDSKVDSHECDDPNRK